MDRPRDVCGAPATTATVDVIRHEVPGTVMVKCTPGARHYGCDAHPAKSRDYVTERPAR